MPTWKRPPGPLNIWKEIEACEKSENGEKKKIRISIQEIPNTKERFEEALEILREQYIYREPMNEALSKRIYKK